MLFRQFHSLRCDEPAGQFRDWRGSTLRGDVEYDIALRRCATGFEFALNSSVSIWFYRALRGRVGFSRDSVLCRRDFFPTWKMEKRPLASFLAQNMLK